MKRPLNQPGNQLSPEAMAHKTYARRRASRNGPNEALSLRPARHIRPKPNNGYHEEELRQGPAKRPMTIYPESLIHSPKSTKSNKSQFIEPNSAFSIDESYPADEVFTPPSDHSTRNEGQYLFEQPTLYLPRHHQQNDGTLSFPGQHVLREVRNHPLTDSHAASPYSPNLALLHFGGIHSQKHDEPWSGLANRDDAPAMVPDTDWLSSASESAELPPTPPNASDAIAARRGPLSPDGRESANEVRAMGACVRCHLMREKCDKGTPCGRCNEITGKVRSFKLPCSREWLDDRWEYLLPDCLTRHLSKKAVDDFIDKGMMWPRDNSEIKLYLTLGFGPELVLDVTEVDPLGHEFTRVHGFNLGQCFEMNSPPLVPRNIKIEVIQGQIKNWIVNILTDDETPWSTRCFRDEEPTWQSDIMSFIFHYHLRYSAVNNALRFTVAAYIMGHSLTVPKNKVASLLDQLQYMNTSNLTDGLICPRAVNRIVKQIVLPITRKFAMLVFKELHVHLFPKADSMLKFDESFCISYCCLVVVGWTQNAILERADSGLMKGDNSFTRIDAQKEIIKLERELADYIIELFHYTFRPRRSKIGQAPRTKFHERLLDILQQNTESLLPANLVEDSIEHDDFKVRNVTRLLSRLCKPLLKS